MTDRRLPEPKSRRQALHPTRRRRAFTDDQVHVGRSPSQDRKRHAKTVSKKGQRDKGDRKD